jgi:uroporphyrinogen-III decarboxylase
MRPEQWQLFKAAAKRQNRNGPIPLALIVDCPWIPPYCGVGQWDYFFDLETWFQCNVTVQRDFPEVIWFPSWWSEVGMGAEPSAIGPRLRFNRNRVPDVEHLPFPIERLDELTPPDPRSDGFMALCLYRYEKLKKRIFGAGFTIPVVAARGPLTIASFFRGVTDLMMDIVDEPQRAKKLLGMATDLGIGWLKAQAEVIGDSVEGILVLDDLSGFIGRKHYQEFAHPFLKRYCDAFPADWVKVFHNDANVSACIDLIPDAGFDVLNWGLETSMTKACEKLGGRMTLMGNVPPLDLGARGTPDQNHAAAMKAMIEAGEHPLILSWGGATTTGISPDNVRALVRAARDFNEARLRQNGFS